MHDVKVPLGPYHPLLKEPEHITLKVRGEKIVSVEFFLGYNHRAIEKLFESRPYDKALFLSERICGICSVAHASCYTNAIERLAGLKPSRRANALRTAVSELGRIQSHLLWLSFLFYTTGFETLFMHAMAYREKVLSIIERIAGNRIHYGFYELGGARADVTQATLNALDRTVKELKRDVKLLLDEFNSHSVLLGRLKGIGILKRQDATNLGVVGPVARASGIGLDMRKEIGYDYYPELDFKIVTSRGQDSLARTLVRFKEIFESIGMIEQLLHLPRGRVRGTTKIKIKARTEVAFSIEAPRGELFYYIRANSNMASRARVRVPTYANFLAIPTLLQEHELADAPVAIMSIDPCFSCMDRALVVNLDTDERCIRNFRDMVR